MATLYLVISSKLFNIIDSRTDPCSKDPPPGDIIELNLALNLPTYQVVKTKHYVNMTFVTPEFKMYVSFNLPAA